MNKFKKVIIVILFVEILIVLICNGVCIHILNDENGRLYRVETKQVANQLEQCLSQNSNLEHNEQDITKLIDISSYKTIKSVHIYDSKQNTRNDYVVEQIDGTLFQIEYEAIKNNDIILYMNISFAVFFICTCIGLYYIDRKLIIPFYNMQNLSVQLAKGNLSMPIKQEKSKFFGRFLWGMDMLRESLEEKKEKELELQKEKKTLILSLSHDIKTPLSAIELYTKALEENLYDTQEKKQEVLNGILRNTREIKNYVNEIVKASREDFLNLEVQSGEFYLSELLNVINSYYSEKLAVLHTEFYIEPVADCLVKGDKDRAVEVMQNIIENAIKYGDGESIKISFDDEENCKLITISNTGKVPTEEELPNLFDSFYRGSNHGNQKGSGLGLYICKTLMRKMEGDVFIKTSDKHFFVTIVMKKA